MGSEGGIRDLWGSSWGYGGRDGCPSVCRQRSQNIKCCFQQRSSMCNIVSTVSGVVVRHILSRRCISSSVVVDLGLLSQASPETTSTCVSFEPHFGTFGSVSYARKVSSLEIAFVCTIIQCISPGCLRPGIWTSQHQCQSVTNRAGRVLLRGHRCREHIASAECKHRTGPFEAHVHLK